MGDTILELARHPLARNLAGQIGVSLPPVLARAAGPWNDRPLADRTVVVGGAGDLHPPLAETFAAAGATVHLADVPAVAGLYAGPAEAFARPLHVDEGPQDLRPDVLVFDGSALAAPADLAALHAFFHPRVRSLARSGRLIVLGRPLDEPEDALGAAAQQALDGFTRSLARELGRKGATANLVRVARGAEERLPALLAWLLSARSVYVTGQPFLVTDAVAGSFRAPSVRPLDGRVALVTGAARGIGAAIARALAREGARVVGNDRPTEDAPLSRTMHEIGGRPLFQDLATADAGAAIVADLRRHEGRLDVVVHNAGVTRDKTLGRMDAERWSQVITVNLDAVARLDAALDEAALLAEGGRAVYLSSIAGLAGNPGQTNYAAAKAGVVGYVRRRAGEVAPRGVAANAVAPGFIETRMTAAIPLMTREVGRRLNALSQGGLPGDVAEVVTFLASPGAAALSGAVVRVCGGSLLGA